MKLPSCPSCKRNNWLEFDTGYYCKNCGYIINKQKYQIDKKVLRRCHDFSTRLNYANKKIKEIIYSLLVTKFNSTDDMIKKLQELKGKTKLKLYKNLSDYYDNMIIRFDEDPFSKNAQGIFKVYHEVLLLKKFLQTEPQVKNMNLIHYDLFSTVNKSRKEKENVDNQNKNDFISLKDVIIPNHYVGRKAREK